MDFKQAGLSLTRWLDYRCGVYGNKATRTCSSTYGVDWSNWCAARWLLLRNYRQTPAETMTI